MDVRYGAMVYIIYEQLLYGEQNQILILSPWRNCSFKGDIKIIYKVNLIKLQSNTMNTER